MRKVATVGALVLIAVGAGVALILVGNQTTPMWLIHGHLVPLDGLGDAGIGGDLRQVEVGRNWAEVCLGAALCVVGLCMTLRTLRAPRRGQ